MYGIKNLFGVGLRCAWGLTGLGFWVACAIQFDNILKGLACLEMTEGKELPDL